MARQLTLPETGSGLRRVLQILPDAITLEEAADLLKLTTTRVHQLVVSNRLGTARWGREIFLSRKAVLEFRKLPRKRGRPRKEESDRKSRGSRHRRR